MPTTTTPRWKWENIWGLGSLIALVAVPWPLAWTTVPHLGHVDRVVGFWPFTLAFLFGVGWGLGGIFWGQAIVMLGLAWALSIMVGLVNVFGSPVPLAMKDPAKLVSPGGLLLLAAMACADLRRGRLCLCRQTPRRGMLGRGGRQRPKGPLRRRHALLPAGRWRCQR